MAGHQSTAAPTSVPREYDPEIKDIAEYVHNYNINSDLAVRFIYILNGKL
jgi:2-methylcitrate dehydratase